MTPEKLERQVRQAAKEFDRANQAFLSNYTSRTAELAQQAHTRYVNLELQLRNLRGYSTDQQNKRSVERVECDIDELRDQIAAGFTPGMSWDNFIKEWTVGPIKTLAEISGLARHANVKRNRCR